MLQCNVFILREDKDKSQQKSLFRALASQKTFRLHLYNHAEAGASCGEDYIDDADALNIPSYLCFDDISVLTSLLCQSHSCIIRQVVILLLLMVDFVMFINIAAKSLSCLKTLARSGLECFPGNLVT